MDTSEIFELLEKFDKSTLSEVIINTGEVKVTLRKPPAHGGLLSAGPSFAAGVLAPTNVAAVAAHPVSVQESKSAQEEGELVTSPIVGTFYRSASPDSPPFVEAGSAVAKGETLCILEAMKVMNELEAEFDCVVLDVLVENGKMVEFGTPLLKVRRV